MKPEQIAKTRAQAIACAKAVYECRVVLFVVSSEEGDESAYKLEQTFWRLAERYEHERKRMRKSRKKR